MKFALRALLLAGCARTGSAPYWARLDTETSPYVVGNVTVYVEEPHRVAERCWWVRGGQDHLAVPTPETPDAVWILLHEFKHVFEGQFHYHPEEDD